MATQLRRQVKVVCRPEVLSDLRARVEELLSSTAVPQHDRELIIHAVDEAVTSVVQYACHKGYDQEITLTLDVDDVRFKAVLNDSLNVFEFAEGGLGLTDLLARERSFQLGIFLIRRIMDEITYTYRRGFENQLEMIYFL